MLVELDAVAVRRWCAAGLDALRDAADELNDLNVYPVPDGDTGTNLALTMAAVMEAVEAAPVELAATTKAMAYGALMGARGNSGVILSQLLRGVAEVLGPLEVAGPADLATALTRAAELAYAAVASPVEGTLLTVVRQSAQATAPPYAGTLAELVRTAREAAELSLAGTPDLLPQLKAAGVVDAGGRGWCVLLSALESVVTGAEIAAAPALLVARDRSGLALAREAGSDAYAYEVQYLLRGASDAAVGRLKGVLAGLGDSLVVVGQDGLHNVHVHVNDIGAALEAGIDAGTPFRVMVTRFADQVAAEEPPLPVLHRLPASNERPAGRTVVAVAAGEGLAALFRAAGAVVVDGGPTHNPSIAQLLAAARSTGAPEVVLLPNDGNVLAVASAAAGLAEGLVLAVVPTCSPLQGLAALSVADPSAGLADDVGAMTAAAAGTRWGEVTRAVRTARTPAGPCVEGDVLGLAEGVVAVIGREVEQVACDLVALLLAPAGELVTVLTGLDAGEGLAGGIADYVGRHHPAVELLVYDGGQPYYPVLLGVE